jgi:biotin operon repressor
MSNAAEKIIAEAVPFVPIETSNVSAPFEWRNFSIEHDALLKKEMKPLEFLVENFIVIPSTGVLASPKKRGKSWMALQLGQCVAQHTDFLGLKTRQGKVVYLALEDGERRLKQRLLLQNTIAGLPITYVYKFEALNSKLGFQQFEDLIKVTQPMFVIIDTLASAKNKYVDENSAGDMADLINKIHELAQKYNCAILIIAHHGKPKVTEDRDAGFDIRGSSAIPGATDFNAGLYKNSDGTTDLKVEGRDIGELELRIKFDWEVTKTWQLLGDAKDVRRSESETNIKNAINTLGGSADCGAIADELGLTRGTVQVQLQRMRDEGSLTYELIGTGKGKKIFYSIPSPTSSSSSSLRNRQHPQLPLNSVDDVGERLSDTK